MPGDLKGRDREPLRIHTGRQLPGQNSGTDSAAGGVVGYRRGIAPREPRVHSPDLVELTVASGVVAMGVSVHHDHRQLGEVSHHITDPADSHERIHQQSPARALDKVGDRLLKVVRLVDGVDSRADAVHLELIVHGGHPFQGGVDRPFGPLVVVLGRRCASHGNTGQEHDLETVHGSGDYFSFSVGYATR